MTAHVCIMESLCWHHAPRIFCPNQVIAMANEKTYPLPTSPATSHRRIHPSTSEALEFSTGRVRDVAALRGLGFSYRDIALHYGVTPQAISLLLARSRKQIKAIGGNPELTSLSTRACSALRRLGVQSRQEALAVNILNRIQNSRNCGRKTINEINDWLAAISPHAVNEHR